MLAFGMPGILELIIIGVILLVPVAIIVAVVIGVKIGKTRSQSNPNLSTCRDCGNSVSIHAENCPKCGCPTNIPK